MTPDALATAVERLRAKAKYIDVESGSPDDWWADAIENMVTALRALPVEQRMEAMGMQRATPPIHVGSHRLPDDLSDEFFANTDPVECVRCHQMVVSGMAWHATGLTYAAYHRTDLPPHFMAPCPANNPPVYREETE